jgi:Transglutaminase-like superfamily
LPAVEPWRARARTAQAIALLLLARVLVAWVPFGRWKARLGLAGEAGSEQLVIAWRLAGHVERGAWRLGLPLKCLPRAMALSWLLRRRGIAHRLVMAARPETNRADSGDTLHAWVECRGETVLGELAGPWIVVLGLP